MLKTFGLITNKKQRRKYSHESLRMDKVVDTHCIRAARYYIQYAFFFDRSLTYSIKMCFLVT